MYTGRQKKTYIMFFRATINVLIQAKINLQYLVQKERPKRYSNTLGALKLSLCFFHEWTFARFMAIRTVYLEYFLRIDLTSFSGENFEKSAICTH